MTKRKQLWMDDSGEITDKRSKNRPIIAIAEGRSLLGKRIMLRKDMRVLDLYHSGAHVWADPSKRMFSIVIGSSSNISRLIRNVRLIERNYCYNLELPVAIRNAFGKWVYILVFEDEAGNHLYVRDADTGKYSAVKRLIVHE